MGVGSIEELRKQGPSVIEKAGDTVRGPCSNLVSPS